MKRFTKRFGHVFRIDRVAIVRENPVNLVFESDDSEILLSYFSCDRARQIGDAI